MEKITLLKETIEEQKAGAGALLSALFCVETFAPESVQRVEQTGLELCLNPFGDLKQGAIIGH